MTSAPSLRAAFQALPALGKLNLALLAAGVAAFSTWLWSDWRENPDLSHGLFMPVVFVLLVLESRRGTPRFLPASPATRVIFGLLLASALAGLVLAGLYAAAVDWSHPLVDLSLAVAITSMLGAALVACSSERRRLLPFNWSALVAIGLWLLTVPLPPGTYLRLTLGLQLWVSEAVLRALHLLGIAAIRHGNVIDLANASVGVEEACSGVRSLISCVFAGFFFSAALVRRPWARALLIALAAPLALGMNFLRSLALTLMANRGIDISGTWHDLTGFAVLGITAALLGALALLLDHASPAAAPAPAAPIPGGRRSGFDRWLAAALGTALALVLFFVANTRWTPRSTQRSPDLFALLPASAAGWQVKSSDLYEFRGALRTEHLAQRHYVRAKDGGEPVEIIIYVAYWAPGQAPVSLVVSHTPDACWPGSGWEAVPTPEPRVNLIAGERLLASAEHRVFQAAQRPQHVWFWHLYDGRPIQYLDPYSPLALLRLAVRYGFRHAGDQLFVRISSNLPWPEIAHEPVVSEFFSRVQPLGL